VKLISYRHNGREAYGVVKDGGIVDMSVRMDHSTLKQAIAGLSINEMEKLAAAADPDVSLDAIEYMFPITTPEKIFCIAKYWKTAAPSGRVFSRVSHRASLRTARQSCARQCPNSLITKVKSA
jgi:hypothetical protein